MTDETCPLCEEPVTPVEMLSATRLGGTANHRPAHRECMVREVMGGIGHIEDHAYWCDQMQDSDGGRTQRQSALEVEAWIHENGTPA